MMHRRTALALLTGTLGICALPSLAATGVRPGFDPADPKQLALAFRKLAYSMDDKVSFWWMKGTRYGVVGSVATPFWEMYVGAWFTTRNLPDGNYEVRITGANFYTAPGDDALLKRFANPYTGRTVEVPYTRPKATNTVYDLKGGNPFGSGSMPGMKTTVATDIGPAWVQGDELMIRGDLVLHAEPSDPAKRTFTVNDWSTYVGSLAAVLDPAQPNPPCAQMFTDVLDFPAWLQMGDQPGTYVSRCYGRKVPRYQDMPAVWRRHFEAVLPDLAADPGALVRFG
jgi:hypothetical protein